MSLGAYDAIPAFERMLANYTGAPFATTVDSCTNALFLCLKYMKAEDVSIPRFTYHSVPMAIINAGGRVRFDDRQWIGAYRLDPYPLWDAARRFTSNMYQGGFWCVSFHSSKILGDTQGGAILHSNPNAREWFEEAQFDGRKRGTTSKTWTPRMIGWHCRMSPDIATRLHQQLAYLPKENPDLPNDEYADLSTWEIFK